MIHAILTVHRLRTQPAGFFSVLGRSRLSTFCLGSRRHPRSGVSDKPGVVQNVRMYPRCSSSSGKSFPRTGSSSSDLMNSLWRGCSEIRCGFTNGGVLPVSRSTPTSRSTATSAAIAINSSSGPTPFPFANGMVCALFSGCQLGPTTRPTGGTHPPQNHQYCTWILDAIGPCFLGASVASGNGTRVLSAGAFMESISPFQVLDAGDVHLHFMKPRRTPSPERLVGGGGAPGDPTRSCRRTPQCDCQTVLRPGGGSSARPTSRARSRTLCGDGKGLGQESA